MCQRIETIALKQINMFKDNFDDYCKVIPEAIKHKPNLHMFAITCALHKNKQMISVCDSRKDKEMLLLIRKKIKEYQ